MVAALLAATGLAAAPATPARAVTTPALTAATPALTAATPALTVAHGDPVPDGQFRFAARLALFGTPEQRRSSPSSVCSGALIDPRWVITAGHCFLRNGRRYTGQPVTGPTAMVGVVDLSGWEDREDRDDREDREDRDGHLVEIVEVWQAPNADVAVARLASPIEGIRPIEVNRDVPQPGQVLRIAGWGTTGAPPAGLTARMQTGQVAIGSVTATTVGVHAHAPSPVTSACPSDSGAPYFLERAGGAPLLVAVENDGPRCPHGEQETASRVDVLADWLSGRLATGSSQRATTRTGSREVVPGQLVAGGLAVLVATLGGLVAVIRRRRTAKFRFKS